MREIAEHLLDLCQNSITAGANLVEISLTKDQAGWLQMDIRDDGCGMDEATRQAALGPFGTSRTTRKVGLGIPLTAQNAAATGGTLTLGSQPGKGTSLSARFDTGHLDCPPLGHLDQTLLSLILANPDRPDFVIRLASPRGQQELDTRLVKAALGEVPLSHPLAITWLSGNTSEMTQEIFGGE